MQRPIVEGLPSKCGNAVANFLPDSSLSRRPRARELGPGGAMGAPGQLCWLGAPDLSLPKSLSPHSYHLPSLGGCTLSRVSDASLRASAMLRSRHNTRCVSKHCRESLGPHRSRGDCHCLASAVNFPAGFFSHEYARTCPDHYLVLVLPSTTEVPLWVPECPNLCVVPTKTLSTCESM